MNECASNPCQNSAPCEDGVDRYRCACLPGFGGVHCDVVTDACVGVTCLNGAQVIRRNSDQTRELGLSKRKKTSFFETPNTHVFRC